MQDHPHSTDAAANLVNALAANLLSKLDLGAKDPVVDRLDQILAILRGETSPDDTAAKLKAHAAKLSGMAQAPITAQTPPR